MAAKRLKDRSWIRYSGLGIEFAAAVVGFTLVGCWVDYHFQCRPWGVVVGVLLGLIGGFYNLIRQSLAAVREVERRSADRDDDGGG